MGTVGARVIFSQLYSDKNVSSIPNSIILLLFITFKLISLGRAWQIIVPLHEKYHAIIDLQVSTA